MESQELPFLTIRQAVQLIQSRRVSPVELTTALLERIAELDRRVNAYITVTAEEALRSARDAEDAIQKEGYLGPLHGIPLAIKDNFWTAGVRTTAGSKLLADFVPTEDSTVVMRLREAGAVILGKLNMHEFAWGATTNNPHFGPARNPWNLETIPSGSSGGSGVALAAHLCLGATGSDTGGSIRHPSTFCGTVGLKPTYGRVSIYGVVPLAWSLDHAGPMTKTVEDAALMLQAIAGYDPRDPTSATAPVPDYTANLNLGIRGLRLGVHRPYFFTQLQDPVRSAVEEALRVLEEMGASIQEVELPSIHRAVDAELSILYPESAAYHRRWLRERPDDYGADVRKNLEVGELIPATQYLQGQQARRVIRDEFLAIFDRVDAFVSPTMPIVATRIGATTCWIDEQQEVDLHDTIIRLTAPFNVIGAPALAIPCGFSPEGLPIGLQVVGAPWNEAMVLRVGHAYESATDWHRRRAPAGESGSEPAVADGSGQQHRGGKAA